MKRSAILTGVVYGYNEDRSYLNRYSPVLVLSLDSYFVPRYGDDRRLQVTQDPRERLNRGGWRTHTAPVGLLAVLLSDAGLANMDEVTARATPEAAVRARNSDDYDDRQLWFGTDAQTGERISLGQYILVTNSGDLHGVYAELVAELAERRRLTDQATQEHEEARLGAVRLHNHLADRLDALGITGYHVREYEQPSRFEGLKFEDMEALLDLAEYGHMMKPI